MPGVFKKYVGVTPTAYRRLVRRFPGAGVSRCNPITGWIGTGVEVSVDGVANDGSPGEEDNIHPDVYTVIGGSAGDLLVGNDGVHRFEGGGDDDRLLGGHGAEYLDGGTGDDTLIGGGDDWLDGGPGDDTMVGQTGDDRFLEGLTADGSDTVDGGPGRDEMSFLRRSLGVVVSLDGLRNDGEPGELDNVAIDVEVVWGGRGADTLSAGRFGSVLFGGVHNDTLIGSDGDDDLRGESGDDTIMAGRRSDFLLGGDGDDDLGAIDGVNGNDTIIGGPGVNACAWDPSDIAIGC